MAEKLELLFETFAGEFVSILLDKDLEQTVQNDQISETHKMPISVEGYFTDMDDDFIYLGLYPNTINQAVKREMVFHIVLSSQEVTKSELEEYLEKIETDSSIN